MRIRKIREGKIFSFLFFSFEENSLVENGPIDSFRGGFPYCQSFGEYFTSERKEICDTLSIKISSAKSDKILLRTKLLPTNFFPKQFCPQIIT